MLLRDSGAILGRVISRVIHGEGTLREAFHLAHAVNAPLVIHPMNDMNEQIEITDGTGASDGDDAGASASAGDGDDDGDYIFVHDLSE